MVLPTTMQGRPFGPLQLAEIRGLLHDHPDWSRYQLSRALARRWNWHGPNGQLKDMAARTLLGKLALRGWIQLPALRRASPTRSGRRPPPLPDAPGLEESPWAGPLGDLLPLQVHEVSHPGERAARTRLEDCLHRHHYLGYQSRVGENLQYWVRSSTGRPLACVVFGAAAWQCAPRDRWIGWTPARRAAALPGGRQQHPLPHPPLGSRPPPGQPCARPRRRARRRRLGGQVPPFHRAAGNLRRPRPLPRHLLSGRQLGAGRTNQGPGPARPRRSPFNPHQRCLPLPPPSRLPPPSLHPH